MLWSDMPLPVIQAGIQSVPSITSTLVKVIIGAVSVITAVSHCSGSTVCSCVVRWDYSYAHWECIQACCVLSGEFQRSAYRIEAACVHASCYSVTIWLS